MRHSETPTYMEVERQNGKMRYPQYPELRNVIRGLGFRGRRAIRVHRLISGADVCPAIEIRHKTSYLVITLYGQGS